MAYLLAVAAALANALTSVLMRLGVETAPPETTLKLSLIAYAVRRKVWIAARLSRSSSPGSGCSWVKI